MSWHHFKLLFCACMLGACAYVLYRSADRIGNIAVRFRLKWAWAQYLSMALRALGLVGMLAAACFAAFLLLLQFA